MFLLKKISKPFALLLMTMVCFSFVDVPVYAQSDKEFKQMKKDIKRFKKEMRAVQRRVFEGVIPSEFLDEEALKRQKSQQALMATMTVRLSRLEREFSTLVGKIEELEYAQRQSNKKYENFTKDIEMQISDLQKLVQNGGLATNSTSNSSTETSPEVPANTSSSTSSGSSQNTSSSPESKNENTLAEPELKPVLPEGSVEDKYNYARQLLRRGNYAGAEAAFIAFMKDYSDHELGQNAQYWLGETYYARKDFPNALEAFYNGYQKYGEVPKGPDSLLKLGLTLANMGEKEEACSAFSELENHYPSLSRNIIRRLKAERGRLGCAG